MRMGKKVLNELKCVCENHLCQEKLLELDYSTKVMVSLVQNFPPPEAERGKTLTGAAGNNGEGKDEN